LQKFNYCDKLTILIIILKKISCNCINIMVYSYYREKSVTTLKIIKGVLYFESLRTGPD
jgi:hypothetical protein